MVAWAAGRGPERSKASAASCMIEKPRRVRLTWRSSIHWRLAVREDMPHLIVERPRSGGDRGRNRRAKSWMDLPKQQGMGHGHVLAGRYKVLNDNLAPLRRYLERQVGRPWNKVYSEICRNLRADNAVQQHVRQHLADFVAIKPRRIIGSYGTGAEKQRYSRLWSQLLYVDPSDGLLKRTDQLPELKLARRKARARAT